MNTQLFLGGKEVDMTDVINIPLNKSFEDLSNPTNINNEFSKTIKIPVSKQNNEVLGNAFRLDRVILDNYGNKNIGQYLNPTKKIPFRLLNNGDLILDGYAKLSLVDYSVNDRFYTLNLFGTLGDLFHKLLNVAVTPKFCPELDVQDIWEDDTKTTLHTYAQAFNTITGQKANNQEAMQVPDNYTWRDMRYLMENKDLNQNYISGKRQLNAQSIKECWNDDPIDEVEWDLNKIKDNEADWQIVGFMPTHHGFPDKFDPTAYEEWNGINGYSETKQFVDTADSQTSFNTSPLIGEGLNEEQFQQFVSWQQKPYIYINKLFMLFQKIMENNPDLFDGYKLVIDPVWAINDKNKYLNPVWSKLCYTFDFLFNQDVKTDEIIYEVSLSDDVEYRHIKAEDSNKNTESIGLRSNLNIDYTGDNIMNTVTLDGYVCIAWPMNDNKNNNAHWSTKIEPASVNPYGNEAYYYNGFTTTGSDFYHTTLSPQLFFNHYHLRGSNTELGYDSVCNGGYRVSIEVFNEEGQLVNKITNAWTPKYLNNIRDYKSDVTKALTENLNGDEIDIVNETHINRAAVLLHRTFAGDQISNGKLYTKTDTCKYDKNYYIGIGFPLRSFGDIPVGVKNPSFRVTIEAMSEKHNAIDSKFQYSIGCYTNFNSKGIWEPSPCNLNSPHFVLSPDWISQENNSNYTTMFFQEFNNSRSIVKYGTQSSDENRQIWLSTPSGDSWIDKDKVAVIQNGGKTWSNGYGRYNSLVTTELAYSDGADALNKPGEISLVIRIGKETTFNSTCNFTDAHHTPTITLENLWVKEDPLFNVLIEYSKIYGLFWVVDSVKKEIKLLTRLTFFENYTIEDWSDKVDYSKDFQVTPILHESKYLNFDYEDEKDATHYTDYGENYLVNYGGYRLKTGYDFTPDDEDLFKGIHTTCMSNRTLLTWNQILGYNPKQLPYVTISPFKMMDCDTKDQTKPIEINNWVFRNASTDLFPVNEDKSREKINEENKAVWTDKDGIEHNKWYGDKEGESYFTIINDTPTMCATQKYMYIKDDRNCEGHYGSDTLKCIIKGDKFPSFDIVSGDYGCLFAVPAQDFTYGSVTLEGEKKVRNAKSDIQESVEAGKWIYDRIWRDWMDERYNINNKKLTCYINLKPIEFANITPLAKSNYNDIYFANFKVINNQLYILNKIFDYNPQSDETTKCEFVQITDINAYKYERLREYDTFYIYLDKKDYTGHTEITRKNGINIFDDIDESNIDRYYSDYFYYGNSIFQDSCKYHILNRPAYDVKYWGENVLHTDGSVGGTIQKLDGEQINNFYISPYFTWFDPTNNADISTFTFTGENEAHTRNSETIGIKNIQAKLTGEIWDSTYGDFEKIGQEIFSIASDKNATFDVNILTNTGLDIVPIGVYSFYEMTFWCTENYSKTGSDQDFLLNVIVPTNNSCIECTIDGSTSHKRFDHSQKYVISTKPMRDSSFGSEDIKRIKNELMSKYDFETVVPSFDTDYAEVPFKLFSTIVWGLDGCSNNTMFNNVNSFGAAYQIVSDIPTIYAGYTTDEYTKSFDRELLDTYINNKSLMFGGAEYNEVTMPDYLEESNEKYAVTLNELVSQFVPSGNGMKNTPPGSFYNNPFYNAFAQVPYIGRSRIMDYYKYRKTNGLDMPYLCDPDVKGNDGYVYQTFCQDLHTREYQGNLVVNGLPTTGTQISTLGEKYECDWFWLDAISQDDSVVDVTIKVDYYKESYTETDESVPYIDFENKTVIIPANTTGCSRTITIVFSIENSLIYEEFEYSQQT